MPWSSWESLYRWKIITHKRLKVTPFLMRWLMPMFDHCKTWTNRRPSDLISIICRMCLLFNGKFGLCRPINNAIFVTFCVFWSFLMFRILAVSFCFRCVCVCVWEREREREREIHVKYYHHSFLMIVDDQEAIIIINNFYKALFFTLGADSLGSIFCLFVVFFCLVLARLF